MADELGIMVTELPEATNIGDDDLFYLVQESYSKKTKTRSLKNSILGNVLGTASGQPASFPDGSDNPLEACNVDINPVQDLHGYDKPWAGGGGKNKLPITATSQTVQGVTFTVNSNGTISLSGTATGRADFVLSTFSAYGGNYTISGAPQNGSAKWNLRIDLTSSGETNQCYDDGTSTSSPTMNTSQGTQIKAVIRVYQGINTNGLIFKPMLEQGTSATTFEPYENICPISGSTSVTVTVSDGETSTTKTTPLGQTVYGGQLNVLTGELTIDRAIVDLGSFNWASENTTVSGLARVGVEEIRPLGALYNQTPICSSYEGVTPKGYTAFNNGEIGFSNNEANPMIRVRNQNFASMTDAQIKSAMNGVTLCYKLATPQTVQLTPQEVNSLLGQNNISADTGDITVVYVRDLNSCISNIISRIEALEQANSNRSLSLNKGLAKSVEEPQEVKEEPLEEEVKEEEQEEVNER